MSETTILAELSGALMTLDIDDVNVGDIMFMGGHLVRRVWTKPADRPVRVDQDLFRRWQGLRLDEPTDGSVARGNYQTAAGATVLILRPAAEKLTLRDQPGYYQGTHFDVQIVIAWGIAHGYDPSIPTHAAELAAEYVKANLAPSGMAASTIVSKIRDTLADGG